MHWTGLGVFATRSFLCLTAYEFDFVYGDAFAVLWETTLIWISICVFLFMPR